MIPVLYGRLDTDYESNGAGKLIDAEECVVIEERNGAYELAMKYPIGGRHMRDILDSNIIMAQPAVGKKPQKFRIYYIKKGLNDLVEIRAEHISAQLSDIVVKPFSASYATTAMYGLKDNAVGTCPFDFYTDISGSAKFNMALPGSIRSYMGGQKGSILDLYGGEYEFDDLTVLLLKDRGLDKGVRLRFGKNIIDAQRIIDLTNTFNLAYGYWQGTNEQGAEYTVLASGTSHIDSSYYMPPYTRTTAIDVTSEFEEEPTPGQIQTKARELANAREYGKPLIHIDVNFIDLRQTEEYKDIANAETVNLCDTVSVEIPSLGINEKAKVTKTEYDVLNERYRSIEIGNRLASLRTVIAGDFGR